MGTDASPDGVTLRILDKDGNEQRQIFGRFAKFYSKRRPINPGSDDPFLGSQDWLTHVLVADSQTQLEAMTPVGALLAATSTGSRLVLVHWNVSGEEDQLEDCITLCKGTMQGNRLSANDVRVLPTDTIMDAHHGLFPEFGASKDFLQNLIKSNQLPSGANGKSSTIGPPGGPGDTQPRPSV